VTIFVSSSHVSLVPGLNISTTVLIGCATFYGIDGKGNTVWEAISFSTGTTPLGRSTDTGIGVCQAQECNANVGMGIGNVTWAYISSFTIQVTSISFEYGLMTASPTFVIGWGQKVGLSNNVIATADVYKITEQGGQDVTDTTVSPAVTVNTAYDYMCFQRLPNNQNEYNVWYRVKRNWPE